MCAVGLAPDEGGGGVGEVKFTCSVGVVVPESVVRRRNVLLFDGREVASSDRDKKGMHIEDCFVSQLIVITSGCNIYS